MAELAAIREANLIDWEESLGIATQAPAILIVDDHEINRQLLKAMLRAYPYRFFEAKRAGEALSLLEREKIDLIVLDLVIPEMGGPEFCRKVKSNPKTHLVPVLMMTSVSGVENEIYGIDSGADEFLIKPVHPSVFRARVRAMLRSKAAVDSLEQAETILFALAQAVESRDHYTAGHCHRLATYSVAVGMAMGLPKPDLVALHRGGYLHDIGKIGLPDRILHGTAGLTADDWAVMRQHTIRGEEICRPMKSLAAVLPIIRSHHEKMDGGGYPDGLRGEEIPLLARVLQVADIYDALTTERSYKRALAHSQAAEILRSEAAKGWRDAELVSLFLSLSQGLARHAEPQLLYADSPDFAAMRESLENLQRELAK